ncbi:uncharacterized protein RHO25_002475 [Cercospora beticola]|nr:hypothetical protein RHO25_002475 [Cercospora beticola]
MNNERSLSTGPHFALTTDSIFLEPHRHSKPFEDRFDDSHSVRKRYLVLVNGSQNNTGSMGKQTSSSTQAGVANDFGHQITNILISVSRARAWCDMSKDCPIFRHDSDRGATIESFCCKELQVSGPGTGSDFVNWNEDRVISVSNLLKSDCHLVSV